MEPISVSRVSKWTALVVATLVVIVGLIFALVAGASAFSRYQARADAHNRVSISGIEIQNQAQRVQIAKQQADIRYQDSVGVREAQDEIARTLTPLYVQYEMIDALKAIATSGKNNTVVYLPSGANGVPLVYNANGGTQVGTPNNANG